MRNLLALIIIAVGISACDTRRQSSLFQPAPSIVGTYTLRSVNAQLLPFAISTAGTTTTSVQSDTMALRSDNTLRHVTVFITNDLNSSVKPVISTQLEAGTFTLAGTTISLGGGVANIAGTYSGGTLTLNGTRYVYVYQR